MANKWVKLYILQILLVTCFMIEYHTFSHSLHHFLLTLNKMLEVLQYLPFLQCYLQSNYRIDHFNPTSSKVIWILIVFFIGWGLKDVIMWCCGAGIFFQILFRIGNVGIVAILVRGITILMDNSLRAFPTIQVTTSVYELPIITSHQL